MESGLEIHEVMQEAETIDTGDTSTIRNNYDKNKPMDGTKETQGGTRLVSRNYISIHLGYITIVLATARKRTSKQEPMIELSIDC